MVNYEKGNMMTDKRIGSMSHAGRTVISWERSDGSVYTEVKDTGIPQGYRSLIDDISADELFARIEDNDREIARLQEEPLMQAQTTTDICLCGNPRHYHLDEDGSSPVHKPGVGACMVYRPCVKFIPVGADGRPHNTTDEVDEGTEAEGCLGHPASEFDPMGETVFCDGSCRTGG